MKKYLLLIIAFVFCALNQSLVEKEINISAFLRGFSSNLYLNDLIVSNIDIEVIDYTIFDDYISVIPINKECLLPINGIVIEVTDDMVKIQDSDYLYTITGVKPDYYLYQYYNSGMKLGSSEQYYIISENAIEVCKNFVLNYEKA